MAFAKLDPFFTLGDGSRISFWKDNWCGESPLGETLPTMYSLAIAKWAKVADIWDNSREEGARNPNFVRPFNGMEIIEVQNFMGLLNTIRVGQKVNDRLFWKEDKKSTYTVRANIVLLESCVAKTTPMKMLWSNCVLPKVCFFAWDVWWGKVFTMKHLKKGGFQMASKCPLCGEAEEDLNQLLIHCPSVWGLWKELISFPRLDWVSPLSPKDLPLEWTKFPTRKRVKKLWMETPLCLFWAIRKERNYTTSDGIPFSVSRLKGRKFHASLKFSQT